MEHLQSEEPFSSDPYFSTTSNDFQTVYGVEIWCLCTFGQKGLKLNNSPIYCLQLYGKKSLRKHDLHVLGLHGWGHNVGMSSEN